MRWVLIKPRNHSPYYDPELQEPLGIECLAAVRRRAGDAVLVLDSVLGAQDDVHLARRAAAFQPDVVGLSLTTAQDLDSVQAIHAEYSRNGRPAPRWVAGGNFVSSEPAAADRLLPAEFTLVRGEGELALGELAAGATPRVLTGRSWAELDTLPWPERPFVDDILAAGWALNVQGSRGCCGACRYCSSPGMAAAAERRWRGRRPAGIAAELGHLRESYGAQAVNFVDEDFLGPPRQATARALDFAAALRAGGHEFAFSIQVRPASLTLEAIDALAAVGLTYVFMGLESDSREDFRRWGRPWTADPWRLVRRLQQHGVVVNVGSLMFHTHSTPAGLRRFAGRLHEHGLLEYRSARNRLDAMPGSAFHREGLRDGRLDPALTGPQALPFEDPAVARLYDDLLAVLDPLGPPSMHALCALPPVLSACRFDARQQERRTHLERISATMDAAVAASFFALLDDLDRGATDPELVPRLRRHNLDVAITGATELVDAGFAPSFADLREAIRQDTGL